MDSPSGNRRELGVAAALLGAAVMLGVLVPPEAWATLPGFCPFLNPTGRPCPTCGLTRSWASLLHGDLGRALASHAGGPALLLGLLAFLGAWAWRRRRPRVPLGWSLGLGGLWAAYAVGRMAGLLPGP